MLKTLAATALLLLVTGAPALAGRFVYNDVTNEVTHIVYDHDTVRQVKFEETLAQQVAKETAPIATGFILEKRNHLTREQKNDLFWHIIVHEVNEEVDAYQGNFNY